MRPILFSLYDYSGTWSKPYLDANWTVIQIDIKLGIDILEWDYKFYDHCNGILSAPPCTDFSLSGAQYWPAKDADGRTAYSISLVRKALEIIEYFKPRGLVFHAMENPIGRIQKCVPEIGKSSWWFHPYHYGENYTKRTYLWGRFVPPMPLFSGCPIRRPIPVKDNKIMRVGGKSEKTKSIRSETPAGFARAFYEANHRYE